MYLFYIEFGEQIAPFKHKIGTYSVNARIFLYKQNSLVALFHLLDNSTADVNRVVTVKISADYRLVTRFLVYKRFYPFCDFVISAPSDKYFTHTFLQIFLFYQ